MDNNIKIYINTAQYKLPTQEDIASAKQFILRREEYARILEDKVDDCLANAAQQIVIICYKYNVDPQKFSISSQYNENMMIEIAEVMDNAEQEILDYIYEDSTSVTNNRSHINALIAWMAILGRGNKNLTDTLDDYLYKAMKDWEAAIATLRYANVSMATAVTKVKSYLHSIYTMPEVRAAFKNADDFNATYIRSRGVQKGGVGLSNNGSTNVTNMAKITLQMAWMKEQSMEYKEEGAAGYYVLRGSSYPCELCDSMVGFHKMEDIESYPPYHGHCCCYVVPVYNKERKKTNNERTQQEETNAIAQAKAKFDAYSEEWQKEYFNPNNGGFNVYHKGHQFSDVKSKGATMSGGQAEKHIGRLLADFNAKQVEFLEENGVGLPKSDMRFDEREWDAKYISVANESTIRKYIEDARKADCAIFYWDRNNKLEELKHAVARTIGKFSKRGELDTIPSIFYINKDGLLKCIFDNT